MVRKLTLFIAVCGLIAQSAYAAAPAPIQSLAQTGYPTMTAEDPPVSAEDVRGAKDRLRQHVNQLYTMSAKLPPEKREVYSQMMSDCEYMLRYMDYGKMKYHFIDESEKKMAEILADGVIDAKEIGEWNKEMRTHIYPAPPMVVKTAPPSPVPSR